MKNQESRNHRQDGDGASKLRQGKKIFEKLEAIERRICDQELRFNVLEKQIENQRKEILSALWWDKIDEITADAKSEEEYCLAIVKWIAGKCRSSSQFWTRLVPDFDLYQMFASRLRVCSEASFMFVEMCDRAGIHAKIWNLYQFGGIGMGHSTAQAWYKDAWHFFDPLYGCYFYKDSEVLSFQQLQAHPEWAEKYILGYPTPLNRYPWRSSNPNDPKTWRPEDSQERAKFRYTPKNIAGSLSSSGFLGELPAKQIRGQVDAKKLASGPIVIGEKDGSNREMQQAGYSAGIAEQLESLGSLWDFFQHSFSFFNADAGERYSMKFIPYEWHNVTSETFRAEGKDCAILSGMNYAGSGDWQIILQPEKPSCELIVRNEITLRDIGMKIDQIIIEKL